MDLLEAGVSSWCANLLSGYRAEKGYCLARVTRHGREAHSALPSKVFGAIYGETATQSVAAAIEELTGHLSGTDILRLPASAGGTLNVARRGRLRKNIIPGRAEVLIEGEAFPALPRGPHSNCLRAMLEASRIAISMHAGSMSVKLREQMVFETSWHTVFPGQRDWKRVTGKPTTSMHSVPRASGLFGSAIRGGGIWGLRYRTAHSKRECVSIDELTTPVPLVRSMRGRPFPVRDVAPKLTIHCPTRHAGRKNSTLQWPQGAGSYSASRRVVCWRYRSPAFGRLGSFLA